jgi:hypothetical protein
MPFVMGNSGVRVEVEENVLLGLLRDPDIHQVNKDGKKIAEPKNELTEVVDGFARPTGILAPFEVATQPAVVSSDTDTGQPLEVVVPVSEDASTTAKKTAK